jgi:4-hydroxy-4-methyl-2-oxoglutarate aldolase
MSQHGRDGLLEAYRGLRVADVSDGLDAVGRRNLGFVDRAIRPIWLGAYAYGRAVTARYVATNEIVPDMKPDEYDDYAGRWYRDKCQYPFMDILKPGDFLVIDLSALEVGLWGSNVGLAAVAKGVTGVAIDGGCRDTAEVALQKCAVWCRHRARTTVIGRLEFESVNQTVNCGGAKASPGDMVVADDDGVIVVPQEIAGEVARWAKAELESDKRGRRALYESLGRPLDDTVR